MCRKGGVCMCMYYIGPLPSQSTWFSSRITPPPSLLLSQRLFGALSPVVTDCSPRSWLMCASFSAVGLEGEHGKGIIVWPWD